MSWMLSASGDDLDIKVEQGREAEKMRLYL